MPLEMFFFKVPIFSTTECQANAEDNGFEYNEGTTCAGGNKKGSCYVRNFFKDIKDSKILPRAIVEEL